MIRFQTILIILFSFIYSTSYALITPLRVNPSWLNANLDKKNIVILDARPITQYQDNHIKGAINFPVAQTYQEKSKNGQVVETNLMQALLRERGIDNNKEIIVYDNGQLIDAARLFWALEVYGLNNVKILKSGFDFWNINNYPISTDDITVKHSKYVVSINHKRIASKFATQLAIKNPNQVVLDARAADSYRGKKSVAKRFGHIPTAINIPVTQNIKVIDGIKHLRSIEELKKIYAEISKRKKIITYCSIGRVSSTNYFVLRELGYDVSNYDASWREWGNDFALPITK